MPPKKKGSPRVKREARSASPSPSEQEILAALPDAGDLVTRTEQKTTAYVVPAYLIYVVFKTDPDQGANTLIRKAYESKTGAAEAFRREYGMWTTSLYPKCHTNQQLERAFLINLMDAKKAEMSILAPSNVPNPHLWNTSNGRVEYEIMHRDDKEMDTKDNRRRKVMIVCEETRYEAL